MTYLFPLHQFPSAFWKYATTHVVHRAQFVLRYKPSFNFFYSISLLSLEFTHAVSSAYLTSRIKNGRYDTARNPFFISQVYITQTFLMPQGRGWELRGIPCCCDDALRKACILRHGSPWTHTHQLSKLPYREQCFLISKGSARHDEDLMIKLLSVFEMTRLYTTITQNKQTHWVRYQSNGRKMGERISEKRVCWNFTTIF